MAVCGDVLVGLNADNSTLPISTAGPEPEVGPWVGPLDCALAADVSRGAKLVTSAPRSRVGCGSRHGSTSSRCGLRVH